MQTLNLPTYDFRIRNTGQSTEIFDCIRRKYVILTPEEWVRQHFVRFMAENLGYPLSLMTLERGLSVNARQKRTDIVVHDRAGKPWMIVECKAPLVKLSAETCYQASSYHEKLKSKFIVVTNGMQHYCCAFEANTFRFLEQLPAYPEL